MTRPLRISVFTGSLQLLVFIKFKRTKNRWQLSLFADVLYALDLITRGGGKHYQRCAFSIVTPRQQNNAAPNIQVALRSVLGVGCETKLITIVASSLGWPLRDFLVFGETTGELLTQLISHLGHGLTLAGVVADGEILERYFVVCGLFYLHKVWRSAFACFGISFPRAGISKREIDVILFERSREVLARILVGGSIRCASCGARIGICFVGGWLIAVGCWVTAEGQENKDTQAGE